MLFWNLTLLSSKPESKIWFENIKVVLVYFFVTKISNYLFFDLYRPIQYNIIGPIQNIDMNFDQNLESKNSKMKYGIKIKINNDKPLVISIAFKK